MPRQKKEGLSPAVGALKTGARKSGNPDFVSSSFYTPKRVNNAFNRALLTLKDNGVDVDRSDILTLLMDRFSNAVEEAVDEDGDIDVNATLAGHEVTSAVGDTATVGILKKQQEESRAMVEEAVARTNAATEGQIKALQEIIQIFLDTHPDKELVKLFGKLDDMSSDDLKALKEKLSPPA